MSFILSFIPYLIIIFGTINLIRMAVFLIGADIYSLKKHFRRNIKSFTNLPTISVVIPAYNEEKSIVACVSSVANNNYPQDKLQIIVVNDGSTDDTEFKVREYALQNNIDNIIMVSQSNLGKANALNHGMRTFATGEFVMCLDADSYLSPDALMHAVPYFKDRKVMAVASNVKIVSSNNIYNLIQLFEYVVAYQMKKALTVLNIEYIIGGVGSTFRRSFLEKIDFYDANTVTEDIDLTMKILNHGNKKVKVVYASDVISYTQGALSLSDLIRQRHRWKWGRYQTFLKNKHMFFSKDKKHTKALSWFYLPFALYSDFAFFFEPLILIYMLFLFVGYHDVLTILSAIIIMSFYTGMNILGEETISFKDKCALFIGAPLIYFLFFMLGIVEYFALIKSLKNIPSLRQSLSQNKANWEPVKRSGFLEFGGN